MSCRVYSFQDVIVLCVAKELRGSLLGVRGIKKVVDYLRDHNYITNDDEFLVVPTEGDVVSVSDGNAIWNAMEAHRNNCYLFALGPIIRDAIEAAMSLKRPTRGKASTVF